MTTPTTTLGLLKGVGSDNWRTYLKTNLAGSLDTLDAAVAVFPPKTYGAVGDGSTNDATALGSCFTAAAAVSGVVRLEPGKTYKVSSRLAAASNVTVWGYGATIAGLVTFGSGAKWYGVTFTWGDSTDMATAGGQSARGVDGLWLEDCTFTYTGTTTAQIAGLIHTDDASARNVTIRGCRFRCSSTGQADGILVSAKTGYTVDNWKIEHCRFEDMGRMGVEFLAQAAGYGGCRNIRISDCLIKNTGNGGGSPAGEGVSLAGNLDHFTVQGCHFDDCAGYSLELANGVQYGTVAGNTFVNPGQRLIAAVGGGGSLVTVCGNTGIGHQFYFSQVDQYTVVGNVVKGLLWLSSATQCVVSGNDVEETASGSGSLIVESCTDCLVTGNRIENLSGSASGALEVSDGNTNRIGHNFYVTAGGQRVYVHGTGTHTDLSVFGRTLVNGASEATYSEWASFSPTWAGFTGTTPTAVTYYQQVGKTVNVIVRTTVAGTSNATTFTMTLPVTADVSFVASSLVGWGAGVDNGVSLTSPCPAFVIDGTHAQFYKDASGAAWTNSGNKSWTGVFSYKAA